MFLEKQHIKTEQRLYSIPMDPSMPQAHTSELDRLRLCQHSAADLRGFHLQNPPFLCMLMCLYMQWRQECTWQSTCATVWISVYRCMNMCVLISDCVHCLSPWLSDFAHYPPLLILCWNTAGPILFLVFSMSCSFLLYYSFFSPSPLLLFREIHCLSHSLFPLLPLSLSHTHIQTYSTPHVVSRDANTDTGARMERN